MRVSDTVRQCVLFIGIRDVSGAVRFGGTAFVVSVPGEIDKARRFPYLVTAKHVIGKIREMIGSGTFVIRANSTHRGSVEFDAGLDHWAYHPDESVDVAVSIFAPPIDLSLDVTFIPIDNFLTDDDISKRAIGAGDEVFMTGLFTKAPGAAKNMPVVRMGNIALMPDEKIPHGTVPIDAYLIEGRSIGGLSGSPAFVSETVRIAYPPEPNAKQEFMWVSGRTYFMGIVRGHWDAPPGNVFPQMMEKVNMGISVVVPAKKIKEILDSPEQKQLRKTAEEEQMLSQLKPMPRQCSM